LRRALITFLSRGIHSEIFCQAAINRSHRFGNDAGSVGNGNGEGNMLNKLLGAAAMAAVVCSTVPASAAKMAGCSGENLSKTESMIETMADGQGKIVAQREVAQAQDAMLSGKMGACAAHLTNAMHVGGMTK
jgi:hypothetical protein